MAFNKYSKEKAGRHISTLKVNSFTTVTDRIKEHIEEWRWPTLSVKKWMEITWQNVHNVIDSWNK